MTGDGRDADGDRAPPVDCQVSVPALLARLDDPDPEVRFAAVETVQDVIEHDPDRCLPTVPKLRGLLEESSVDRLAPVVSCLATLAGVSPADVAPSADAVARFVRSHPSHPGRTDAMRCLTRVAETRPDAVVEHVDALADALAESEDLEPADLELFRSLSTTHPDATVPALEAILETEPDPALRDRIEHTLAEVNRYRCRSTNR